MAWLSVPDDTESAEIEALTEPWRSRGGAVPPVIGVLKRNPRAFRAVLELNYAVTFGASSLGRRREELIAVLVSALNECFFCLATHARYLEQVWESDSAELPPLLAELLPLLPQLRVGDEAALIALEALPALRAGEARLLRFVAELSRSPEASTFAGQASLREAGYSETELLDAVLVSSCFAFMNRLASGTGVALDAENHASAERLFGRAALEQHIRWCAAASAHE